MYYKQSKHSTEEKKCLRFIIIYDADFSCKTFNNCQLACHILPYSLPAGQHFSAFWYYNFGFSFVAYDRGFTSCVQPHLFKPFIPQGNGRQGHDQGQQYDSLKPFKMYLKCSLGCLYVSITCFNIYIWCPS